MKVCPKCGKYNGDTSERCTGCSESLANAKIIESIRSEFKMPHEENTEQNIQPNTSVHFTFIDDDEKNISKLGSGYLQNIITGGNISSVNAILTQKRLYLSGKTYTISKNTLSATKESKIINIEDITGTGFIYTEKIIWLIISVFFLIVTLISLITVGLEAGLGGILITGIFAAIYFINRKSIFKIEYFGGNIGFDVKMLNTQESVNFQKMIYQVKDQRKKELLKECVNEMKNT